jgi:glyoxylate/hydroxypyruvate reductase A
MATWVLWAVINIQRKCDAYWEAQRARRWAKEVENFRNIDNSELRIGVMGLGVMGGTTADTLLKLGYPVSAWTRSPKEKPGVRCYHGREQLRDFASSVDVLVCLLPLTDSTR